MSDHRASEKARALGLCSGGLDSILSALLLRRQGIEVTWISFETPFFDAGKARRAAGLYEIPLKVQDITFDYLRMLKNPRAGYGKNMNPCMDCHALMFNKAGEVMRAEGFDFLFSGEVLGQRPMSQNAPALNYVAKHSGSAAHILRPLSALKLPETHMEASGLVERGKLLGLNGRSRKQQMELAVQWGVSDYPAPAGGCLLTDAGYCRRLQDLIDHEADLAVDALNLLKYGRHFRLSPSVKIIVGRTKEDNERLMAHCNPAADAVLKVKNYPGPTVIMPGAAPREMQVLAGAICAGYSKAPEGTMAVVQIAMAGATEQVTVLPVPPRQARRFLIQ